MPTPVSIPLIIFIGFGTYFEITDEQKFTKQPFPIKTLSGVQIFAGPGGNPGFWLSNTNFGHLGGEIGLTYTFEKGYDIWRPIVGVKYFMATPFQHYGTSQFLFAGAGFTYDKQIFTVLNKPVYLTFPFMIGPHYGTNKDALGGPIAFNYAPGIAVDVNKSLRVSFSYDHTSNGFTALPNFGINSLVLGAHYKF